jgi:hypothetical protein
MRRILLLVTVALVMAAMMLVMAMPAFAQEGPTPNPNASCVGTAHSRAATTEQPGYVGTQHRPPETIPGDATADAAKQKDTRCYLAA